jgi:hypothetical protein
VTFGVPLVAGGRAWRGCVGQAATPNADGIQRPASLTRARLVMTPRR